MILNQGSPFGRGRRASAAVSDASAKAARLDRCREIVTSWVPQKFQRQVLAGDAGIDVAIAGVGGGKSEAGALKLARWALENPRRADGSPTCWLVLGKDLNEVRDVLFQKILNHLRRLSVGFEAIVERVVMGGDPQIHLWNGARIYGRSGTDPERLRAYEYDGAWMDEAAIQSEKAFEIAFQRQRSAKPVRFVVTSSPKPGWLWRLISGEDEFYARVRRTVPVRVHRWTSSENTTNDQGVLDAVRAVAEASDPGAGRQELDGLFLGTAEAPGTGVLDFERAFVGRVALEPRDERAAVVGVDLAMSIDYTVFVVLSETGVVLETERFNLSTVDVQEESYFLFLEDKLAELVGRWRAPLVKVDTAMFGLSQSHYFAARLKGIAEIEGYATQSKRRKSEAIEAMGVALSRGQIRVPSSWIGHDGALHLISHVETLRLELKKLHVEYRDGTRYFDHPKGGHDDCIVALALAWQGLGSTAPPPAPLTNVKPPPLARRFGGGGPRQF